jgi:hypothetical protein
LIPGYFFSSYFSGLSVHSQLPQRAAAEISAAMRDAVAVAWSSARSRRRDGPDDLPGPALRHAFRCGHRAFAGLPRNGRWGMGEALLAEAFRMPRAAV